MRTVFGFLAFLVSSALLSQAVDIPVTNWTVPPYSQPAGGLTTMTDFTPPRVFIAVAPCRVVDTRNPAGPYGGPALLTNIARTFDIDNGPCPGLPAGIEAYSLNFGGILPPADGFLTAWPTGIGQPVVSQLNLVGGEVVANAAIVPAGTNGAIDVLVNIGPTHVYIDINGYFSDVPGNPQNDLVITNNSSQYSIVATNNSLTCTGPCGIRGNVQSTAGAHAVSGYALGTSGINFGVYGETDTTTGGGGAPGTDSAGVKGVAIVAGAAPTHGVVGETHSTSVNGGGVVGRATSAGASAGLFSNTGAGLVYVATQSSAENYAILTTLKIRGGSLDITGTKNFVSPHPEDPSLEIRYASVEAPTVDVYFRGTAMLVNGVARIEVPGHFRFTAREGTYMTELTPVGRPIALSVEEEGPEGIVVRGTGNARFHYVVYAERAEIVGYEPVTRNTTFSPELLERLGGPEKLPEPTRALLVRNGTLNADGSYNLETARVQGWTIPERSMRPAPEPAP
jgi:hypothetical protein